MKKIKRDIQGGQFERVYLLYGKERYNRIAFTKRLCNALLMENDTMNFSRFEGEKVSESEIIEMAETLPFFAERRVVLVKDTELFKKATEQLQNYIASLPKTTILIFSEEEADKRGRLYKAVSKAGYVCEFTEQKEETLRLWGASLLKRNGFRITCDDMSHIIACTGTDMTTIATELDKVMNYAQGAHPEENVVTRTDIDTVISVKVEDRIFEMIAALVRKEKRQAFSLYADLLALQKAPIALLILISREYDRMLKVLELSQQGMNENVIADNLGLKPFIIRKTLGNARSYDFDDLRRHLAFAISMEEAVKTGVMKDQMALELMLTSFCMTHAT